MNLPIKTVTEIIPVGGEKAVPLVLQSDGLESFLGRLKARVADYNFGKCVWTDLACCLRTIIGRNQMVSFGVSRLASLRALDRGPQPLQNSNHTFAAFQDIFGFVFETFFEFLRTVSFENLLLKQQYLFKFPSAAICIDLMRLTAASVERYLLKLGLRWPGSQRMPPNLFSIVRSPEASFNPRSLPLPLLKQLLKAITACPQHLGHRIVIMLKGVPINRDMLSTVKCELITYNGSSDRANPRPFSKLWPVQPHFRSRIDLSGTTLLAA